MSNTIEYILLRMKLQDRRKFITNLNIYTSTWSLRLIARKKHRSSTFDASFLISEGTKFSTRVPHERKKKKKKTKREEKKRLLKLARNKCSAGWTFSALFPASYSSVQGWNIAILGQLSWREPTACFRGAEIREIFTVLSSLSLSLSRRRSLPVFTEGENIAAAWKAGCIPRRPKVGELVPWNRGRIR